MSDRDWTEWVGRTRVSRDCADLLRASAMQATLESPAQPLREGDALPELWHWLYFWEIAPLSALGYDGHPAKGDFLPPIDLPRRMWAGSRLRFLRPIAIGAEIVRRSEIASVAEKTGRSGKLAFVTVKHEVESDGETCLQEEHDIVYRARPSGQEQSGQEQTKEPEQAPRHSPWLREVTAGPVMLFRYSALTFNGHRIHYDQPFSVEQESYDGLIVHGPLLATLMVDLARRNAEGRSIARFAFRAKRPLFAGQPFTVCGEPERDGARLCIGDASGALAMDGDVGFSDS